MRWAHLIPINRSDVVRWWIRTANYVILCERRISRRESRARIKWFLNCPSLSLSRGKNDWRLYLLSIWLTFRESRETEQTCARSKDRTLKLAPRLIPAYRRMQENQIIFLFAARRLRFIGYPGIACSVGQIFTVADVVSNLSDRLCYHRGESTSFSTFDGKP